MQALCIGTGPSFFRWVEKGNFPSIPKYGCSIVPWYCKVDTYAYGDEEHLADVPVDGTRIVSTDRVWKSGHDHFDMRFPHGGSSGGMAITMACRGHRDVGLIGYDGGLPEPFESDIRKLLQWWIYRGRRFYSLMESSTFDDLMSNNTIVPPTGVSNVRPSA